MFDIFIFIVLFIFIILYTEINFFLHYLEIVLYGIEQCLSIEFCGIKKCINIEFCVVFPWFHFLSFLNHLCSTT